MMLAFGTISLPLTFCFVAYGEGFSKGEARLPPSRVTCAISVKVVVKRLFALKGQQKLAQGKLVFERRPGLRSQNNGVP